MQPTEIVLLVAVGLFGAYLFVQFRPGGRRARRRLDEPIRRARAKAHAAKTDGDRAEALAEAGEAAVTAKRWVAAAGYFLRAMRAAPASGAIVDRAGRALASRPEVAESAMWRRVSSLPDDDAHRPAFVAAVEVLARIYETSLPNRGRARVLRRLVALEPKSSPKDPSSVQ